MPIAESVVYLSHHRSMPTQRGWTLYARADRVADAGSDAGHMGGACACRTGRRKAHLRGASPQEADAEPMKLAKSKVNRDAVAAQRKGHTVSASVDRRIKSVRTENALEDGADILLQCSGKSMASCAHYWITSGQRKWGEIRMPASQVVAQYVPFLRRYARALTGTQASGDSYVAATLEALVKEPNLLTLAGHSRTALYQVFSRIWNSVAVNVGADRAANLMPAERHLGQITAMPRQAFLLVAVEGFTEEDAAAILDVDKQTLQDLVDQSGRELAAEIATDVLIIEDEMVIALDLEQLVENLGHRTIGIARTREEAIALAKEQQPGLILADIQLADGSSGLEAVNDLLNSFEVPVIFITAHPERFLTGERPEPTFLIVKPYQQSTASALISQALFFERNARRAK